MEPQTEQKSNLRRFLKFGCLGILLVVVILSIPIIRMAGRSISAFKATRATTTRIREKFGPAESYSPEPGKIINIARLKVFLDVRESLKPVMNRVEASQREILAPDENPDNDSVSIFDALRVVKKAGQSLPELANYFTERNNRLIQADMGLGEYFYTYAIVYYAWLGYTPDDGPDFESMAGGGKKRIILYAIQDMLKSKKSRDSAYSPEFWESFDPGTIGRVRALTMAILTNQHRKGRKLTENPEIQAFHRELEAEIQRIRKSRVLLPWQHNLPSGIAGQLEPYRDRLKSCYSKALNPVEFGIPLE